ncbi:MAG TPA: ATP-binding protein [Terrimicrobiaceae bacterium]|nr:ATP-binding protein [Terrimicrobiaceae bacterium]
MSPEQLSNRCDPAQFEFETTGEIEELTGVLGQTRAVEAIQFGIGIQREGYNLFAAGPTGSGRRSILRRFIDEKAAREAPVSDCCYVHNFQESHKPRALKLPPGRARKLKLDLERLIEELRTAIPAAFDSDEYRAQRQQIEGDFGRREENAMAELRTKALERDIALISTPGGFAFAPTQKGEVIEPQAFKNLPEKERESIQKAITELHEELEKILREVPRWRRELQRKIRELNRMVTSASVSTLIDDLKKDYEDCPGVASHLTEVREDIVENVEIFFLSKEGEQPHGLGVVPGPDSGDLPFRRYRVNVLIDHNDEKGAPVVYEDNPTHDNLIGRIEYVQQMGVLLTDFTLIKPGALHRANGGYLILDAIKVLLQPFAWEALKRALRSREIRIESVGQMLSLISTVSLRPEPIPLNVKVVLVGERLLYYLLYHLDQEFGELFKVAADFEEDIARSPETATAYARLIGTLSRQERLRPFDRQAVARMIEHSSRLAGDAGKLSVRMQRISDLLCEADYWAGKEELAVVGAAAVQRAIDAQEERSGRLRARLQEEILRETLLIDTEGEQTGQVNGLSCIELGGFAFGHPSRITARVRLGGGKLVDIEREVEMGGPIHSKGVLILAGFLQGRYVPDRPLTLSASLVFEQNYGGVEGDSASLAELCTLLSALADAPIRQSLAVTGSINQHGQVQAVGAVNEKIEGFFDVCKARGLTGKQGVLIPSANVKHLMLRHEVIEACAASTFSVHAVDTIDQAIELLTGVPAGERTREGAFPKATLNQRVEQRLVDFAEHARAFQMPMDSNQRERPK